MLLAKESTPVHKKILTSVTSYLQKKGYENIRAQGIEMYKDPAHITRHGADEAFTPDVTARRYGAKHYFEIVNYARKNKDLVISKWMVLSTLAKHLRGQLHLMVPLGQMSYTQRILQANNIEAQVLSLKNI
jgi:uncharacterized protein (UPF0297 family)